MAFRKAGLGFILVTLFLDIFGIGLILPILPRLLESFVDNDTIVAARYYGMFAAVYALMQFIFSPVLGGLSDRFGRRPVLLLSLLGSGLDYILLAFAPSLSWLFIGRVIAGVTGASIGTATAYIADVSPPEKRAQNFGLIGMAFGLGFIAGPALGGLLGSAGLRTPFLVAAGLTLANAAYGLFVLPESLGLEHRRAYSWRRANPIGSLLALKRYPVVLSLTGTLVLVQLAQRGLESVWVLYTGFRYSWDVKATGLSLAVVGLGATIVQGGLVRRIIPALGEQRSLLLGLCSAAAAFALYGLVPEGWMIYAVLPLGSIGGLTQPAAQGMMSRAVPLNEQGLLQGALSSLQSLTQIVGPLIATNLFSFFSSPRAPVHLPGISFLAGSLMILASVVLAARSSVSRPPLAQQVG